MKQQWELVIGMEVHAQLLTKTKMFCSCSADYSGAEPNTHVCPICMGAPGMMPVVNETALRYGIMAALAFNCTVPEMSWFERKNYPYPDLVKGFQLTQYKYPIGSKGYLDIVADGKPRRLGLTRVHLEEDTAKLTHFTDIAAEHYSLVDCNRSGVPLMEIVGEPDCRTPEEAVQYLHKLRDIIVFLGICDGRMEEGSMRLEANISVRTHEEAEAGIYRKRCEVKNINSFEGVRHAIEWESKRQIHAYEHGEEVKQLTLGWDAPNNRCVVQRSKEDAADYRYFPEPDLPPLYFTAADVDAVRKTLPELRHQIIERYKKDYKLDDYRAELLTATRSFSQYFEACLKAWNNPDKVSNVLLGDFSYQAKELGLSLEDCSQLPVAPEEVAEAAKEWDSGDLTGPQFKQVMPYLFEHKCTVAAAKKALKIEKADTGALEGFVDAAIKANPDAVKKIKSGNAKVLKFLVGQVMKASRGQGDPKTIEQLLSERLGVY